MPADALYFDTTYLVRIYLQDHGFEAVRALAASAPVFSAWHGQAEAMSGFHRAFRERRIPVTQYQDVLAQFRLDCGNHGFHWLQLHEGILTRVHDVLAEGLEGTFLRAADALHLACAAENGFSAVYSNDRHFLAAAPHFGLRALNIIPSGAAA